MDKFDLGEALLKYRTDHRLSQKEMGEELGMSRQAYDRLEKGLRKPTYEEFQRYSKVIGLITSQMDVATDSISYYPRKFKIYDLKRQLLYGTDETSNILQQMKDLAKAVDCPPLLDWAHFELKGYFRCDEIPAYRDYGRSVEVDYKSGREKIFNFPIPSEMIDPWRLYSRLFAYCDEIRFETLLALGDPKAYEGADDLSAHMHSILQGTYGQNIEVRRVVFVTSTRVLLKVLLAVQEILLRFLQDLERKFGPKPDMDDLKAAGHIVTDLFIRAKNRTGDASHLDTPFIPKPPEDIVLAKGDYESFRIWCEDHDLMEYDELTDEFLVLLEEQEKAPLPRGIIPPEVYEWVTRVIAENSRFGPKGEKLIDALKIFYGVTHG